MTPNQLTAAGIILDFIGKIETGRTGNDAYLTIFGHHEDELPKPLTSYTVGELLSAQVAWGKKWKSSAAGRYQIIRKTLAGLVASMGIDKAKKFTPELQDQFGLRLLTGRGLTQFLTGAMSVDNFALELAKEWASMPVLKSTKGASRQVSVGQSYYAGDGLNKSLVKPDQLREVLAEALAAAQEAPPKEDETEPDDDPVIIDPTLPTPRPSAGRPGWLTFVGLALFGLIVGAATWYLTGGPAVVAGPDPELIPRAGFLSDDTRGALTGIGVQILMSFIAPIAAAAAASLAGYVGVWWAKLFKVEFDAKSAESLRGAFERGILLGFEKFGSRATKSQLLSTATEYAAKWNPGTIKRLGLDGSDLHELAEPVLAKVKRDK